MKKSIAEQQRDSLATSHKRQIGTDYVFYSSKEAIYFVHTLSDREVKFLLKALFQGDLRDDMMKIIEHWTNRNDTKKEDGFD